MKNKINKTEYLAFVKDIKERIYRAQYDALKVVNKELIELYWDLGEKIVEKQKRFGWVNPLLRTWQKTCKRNFLE